MDVTKQRLKSKEEEKGVGGEGFSPSVTANFQSSSLQSTLFILVPCYFGVKDYLILTVEKLKSKTMFRVKSRTILLVLYLYGLQQVFFIERDPHSYTRHIERVTRGERDIVPSTQD